MMWFVAFSEKEKLGIENRESEKNVLYGLAILSFMKRNGIHIQGFRAFLLSGSLDASWEERIRQETRRQDLLVIRTESEKLLILATSEGHMQLRRMEIPEDKICSLTEKEVYQLLKSKEGETKDRENR